MRKPWAGILLALLWAGAAAAQTPAGTEFHVNAATTDPQSDPAVAMDASGNFIVVWTDYPGAGTSGVIRGRRFSASGAPLGSEIPEIDSYATSRKQEAQVAADAGGDFVVVWVSYGQVGTGDNVFAQRFDWAGARRGGEFLVNTDTGGSSLHPAVASTPSGAFVVVWQGYEGAGGSSGVFGQRYDASGAAVGTAFHVNTYTTGHQGFPAVAIDDAGEFVVTWVSKYQDGSGYGVFGQRFDAAGNRAGSEFRVNSYTTADQDEVSVAMSPAGAFVVAWESTGQDGSNEGLFAQRYDATGSPQGGEFQVNTFTTGGQRFPSVAMDKQGGFLVVWAGGGGPQFDVIGRSFDGAGLPRTSEFVVNTYTTDTQAGGVVALDRDGDAVVTWHSADQGGSMGQRYGDLIFQDGFESGNPGRWSAALTGLGNLAVNAAAALAGTSKGLKVFVGDTNPLYVEDDTPVAETRYSARFYFNPNGFDPGEDFNHHRVRVGIARDGAGQRLVAIVLRRQVGDYALEARVRLDDGTRVDTGFFPITNAPHFVEFDWRRPKAAGGTTGTFTFRIDGVVLSSLTGLANGASGVESLRMGAMSAKEGAFGTLYFDQFESRRNGLIGPE